MKNFLNEKSVRLAKYWNYATIAPDGSYYWMNPREEAVNNNWSIVLNDTFNRCLTVFLSQEKLLLLMKMNMGLSEEVINRNIST